MSRTRRARLSIMTGKGAAFTSGRPLQMGLFGALCILSFVQSPGVQAQKPQGKAKHKPAAGGQKANVSAGRTLFVKNCSPCHGANGQGSEGPSLQKLTLTDATIGTTIKKGVKGEMPAFGSKLKDADVKALIAFVHSIKK